MVAKNNILSFHASLCNQIPRCKHVLIGASHVTISLAYMLISKLTRNKVLTRKVVKKSYEGEKLLIYNFLKLIN